jgi:hypothetical protein
MKQKTKNIEFLSNPDAFPLPDYCTVADPEEPQEGPSLEGSNPARPVVSY